MASEQVEGTDGPDYVVFDRGYMRDESKWCYWDAEYPDEGAVGPFDTREEAEAHARSAGYLPQPFALSDDEREGLTTIISLAILAKSESLRLAEEEGTGGDPVAAAHELEMAGKYEKAIKALDRILGPRPSFFDKKS